jgi:branched-chain amino acid transport system ATP-binding protein
MALLELNGITKLFGKLAAIENIDLQVQKGEILGVVGPNGSGKTTLINVISGYYKPTHGSIYLEGHKISALRPDQIARQGIARTFQANILHQKASVIESMLISSKLQYKTNDWQSFFQTPAYRAEHEKVIGNIIETLRFLDISEEAYKPSSALSHGHQRMLGIAIALEANPRILLLDEPTTGMNHEEAMLVVENIKKINDRGVTILLIEHNMKVLLNVATRVVVLSYGNKIADGDPHEMMSKRDVVEAYLGTETI